jgi:hypothetical protein
MKSLMHSKPIELVTPEHDWFAAEVPSAFSTLLQLGRKNPRKNVNPCLILLGAGPTEFKCKHCVHFYRKRYSKTYYKCELRGDTNGPGTDHRANWPTCMRFEKNESAKV